MIDIITATGISASLIFIAYTIGYIRGHREATRVGTKALNDVGVQIDAMTESLERRMENEMNDTFQKLVKAVQLRDTTDENAIVRTVLETLREPTPNMRIAGGIAWSEALPDAETYVDTADACFKAMIDEILE